MGLLSRSPYGMRHPSSQLSAQPWSLKLPDTLGPDPDILGSTSNFARDLSKLDGAVPTTDYGDASLDPALGTAGLAMMDAATPDQPDFMQVRHTSPYQRTTPWSYKPYGQY